MNYNNAIATRLSESHPKQKAVPSRRRLIFGVSNDLLMNQLRIISAANVAQCHHKLWWHYFTSSLVGRSPTTDKENPGQASDGKQYGSRLRIDGDRQISSQSLRTERLLASKQTCLFDTASADLRNRSYRNALYRGA